MNSQQPSAFNLSPPPTQQWQPAQAANFNAIAGRAYPVNTTAAAITVTLPLSPNPGDLITLTDYAGTWDTNNMTISPNGNKVNGSTVNGVVSTERGSVNLVYIDSTQGWISYASNLSTSIVQTITATGGNEIKTVGSYKYHIFTANGTFTVTAGAGQTFEVMACGGGAGGGYNVAGGGGGGELDLFTSVTASASAYTVTVGAKGNGGTTVGPGVSGGFSSFALGGTEYVKSLGGGAGGGYGNGGTGGGSGGGQGAGGTGTAGPASGSNTTGGGTGATSGNNYGAGGGGGATTAGSNGSTAGNAAGGNGGEGYTLTNIDSNFTSGNFTSFSGMTVISSGGGGGALRDTSGTPTRGVGGTGAGSGGVNSTTTNTHSATNASSFGSGGGGGGWSSGSPNNANGGNGYDGVVIVRYLA